MNGNIIADVLEADRKLLRSQLVTSEAERDRLKTQRDALLAALEALVADPMFENYPAYLDAQARAAIKGAKL